MEPAVGARYQLHDTVAGPPAQHRRSPRRGSRPHPPRQSPAVWMETGKRALALADDRLERQFHADVARHIHEGPAVPQRIVQRGQLVLVGRDEGAEIALNELGMFVQGASKLRETTPWSVSSF